MLNGVNNLNDELNNAQLDKQLGISGVVTNPIKNPYANVDRSMFIDETAVSDEAIKLYEREQDVKKFNVLAMSDIDDLSHEEIIANLFSKGVSDPFSDAMPEHLAENQRLLEDLSL